jgi:hypothetical protein
MIQRPIVGRLVALFAAIILFGGVAWVINIASQPDIFYWSTDGVYRECAEKG